MIRASPRPIAQRRLQMHKDTKMRPTVANRLYAWVPLLQLMSFFDFSFVRSAAAFTPTVTPSRSNFLTRATSITPRLNLNRRMHKRRTEMQTRVDVTYSMAFGRIDRDRSGCSSLFLYNSFGNDDSESSSNDLDDWREFQQRLIANEESEKCNRNSSTFSSISSTTVHQISNIKDVMPGSILLATLPSKDEQGYGLGRQYLHKSIIYIIDIDFESGVTALILNRGPMFELGLLDIEGQRLDGSSDGWIVNLGGDSFPVDKEMGEVDTSASGVTCLFFQNKDATSETCNEICSGVYFTTQCTARGYVHEGLAKPDDFWLFYGHMHWSIEDFRQEMRENIWTALDITQGGKSGDVLRRIWSGYSFDFGRSLWRVLCDTVEQKTRTEDSFDDQMLEEYCLASLPMTRANRKDADSYEEEYTPRRQGGVYSVNVGDILRASSASHSPFLLSDQEYHKSMILIIQEESRFSVGVILNLPTPKSVDLEVGGEQIGSITIKYGGPLECAGRKETDLLFLHKSKAMKDSALGEHLDVDSSSYNIWKCTKEEATEALVRGIATEDEIMGIDGLCVWPKDGFGGGGLRAELVQGNFQRVPLCNYDKAWKTLQQQTRLSSKSLDENFRTADAAWKEAGTGKDTTTNEMTEERRLLANEAHREWIHTYLLRLL